MALNLARDNKVRYKNGRYLQKEDDLSDRDDKEIGKILRDFLAQRRQKTDRTGCPDDETLANYLEGLLEDHEAMRLEAHLAQCSFCVEDVVAVHKSIQDREGEKVLRRIIDRAMSLVPEQPQENCLDLMVRLVKGSVELVSTSGQLVLTSPAGVRARPKTSQTTILQVEKEMAKFIVAVEVGYAEASLCQVVVRIKGETGKPADGIRLSLLSARREHASYLTRQGVAVFDRIPLGAYTLAISDSDTPVGTVRLGLTD